IEALEIADELRVIDAGLAVVAVRPQRLGDAAALFAAAKTTEVAGVGAVGRVAERDDEADAGEIGGDALRRGRAAQVLRRSLPDGALRRHAIEEALVRLARSDAVVVLRAPFRPVIHRLLDRRHVDVGMLAEVRVERGRAG